MIYHSHCLLLAQRNAALCVGTNLETKTEIDSQFRILSKLMLWNAFPNNGRPTTGAKMLFNCHWRRTKVYSFLSLFHCASKHFFSAPFLFLSLTSFFPPIHLRPSRSTGKTKLKEYSPTKHERMKGNADKGTASADEIVYWIKYLRIRQSFDWEYLAGGTKVA